MKQPPAKVAELVIKAIPDSPVIGKLEVSGPGFINITLSTAFIQTQVRNIKYSSLLFKCDYYYKYL